MKFLIKLFCLLSLLSSFCFSFEFSDDVNYDAFRGQKFEYFGDTFVTPNFFYGGYIRIENDVFELKNFDSPPFEIFNVSISNLGTGFRFSSKYDLIYVYSSSFPSAQVRCVFDEKGEVLSCSNKSLGPPAKFHTFSFALYYGLSKVATCGSDENFNIKTKKCSPACPAGQFWDIKNSICYSDCSDKNLNKFGYSNGTAQGGCVDCSNALSDDQIMRCACSGFGSSYEPGVISEYPSDPSFKLGSCKSGDQIRFKSRLNDKDKDKDKKKDNNSTNLGDNNKDKDNPKPDKDKDKRNDNNSTNSSDKDNPKPDKKDNNENSNNSSGESGNSSNNNSGGSSGNGSSGGGGTGVETKPNPNYNGNGKEDGKGDGKQDGKGEEGKGDDAVAQKLDYGDLEKDSDKFNSDFKGALDSVISQAQDFKNSLNDTISKIKEGGLAKFNQSAIPNTCPLTYNVDFSYFRKDITFDICKVIAPASQTLYYFFYVVFFVLFLIVTIKLFLFTF